jgi:hypothetical protein
MTTGPNSTAWDGITAQAASIVAGAGEAGVTLRVLGSVGIRLHCAAPGPLMDALDRPVKDIDLLVPEKQRKPMRRYLESLGYVTDRDLLIAMEGTRYCFRHPDGGAELDVFVERLNFCHPVEVKSRLHLHQVTLPIEELLLAKLQIVELTTTDVMDLGVILATHDIGAVAGSAAIDPEVIDARHLAGLFAKDWGFHHTATRNLRKVAELCRPGGTTPRNPSLTGERHAHVTERVEVLLAAIDAEPKSLAWRMRDKVGERKQWWQDVDEKEATY